MLMNAIPATQDKSSVSRHASLLSQNVLLKIALSALCVWSLAACQPTDGTSENKNDPKTDKQDNALSAERSQNIEALAGVPMQQLASFDPQEIKQGGDTGISITSAESYSKPSSNLTASRKGSFLLVMRSFNNRGWLRLLARTAVMVLARYSMLPLANHAI